MALVSLVILWHEIVRLNKALRRTSRMNWFAIFAVACGGSLGAVARGLCAQKSAHGVLLVNLVGCFFIGVASVLISRVLAENELVKLFLVTGVLGGLTTFSSFGLDVVEKAESDIYASLLLLLMHVIGGLTLVVLGRKCAWFFS